MKAHLGKLKTGDGAQLYYEYWIPENPRALMVFVHGLGEHCGRYGSFVRYFTDRGFVLALYDQRGHGKSSGPRVDGRSLDLFLDDLSDFAGVAAAHFPNISLHYLAGHSFGGQVVLNFAGLRPHFFAGVIACSPNLGVALPLPTWKKKMADWLLQKKPSFRLGGMIHPHWLSHDLRVVRAYAKDPLVSRFVTVQLGQAILKNLEQTTALAQKIKNPLLLVHGTADRVCHPQATARFYEEVPFQDKEIRLYEGLYHELLNESTKEQVFGDIAQWLEKRLFVLQ